MRAGKNIGVRLFMQLTDLAGARALATDLDETTARARNE
jgi:hypothetical protein